LKGLDNRREKSVYVKLILRNDFWCILHLREYFKTKRREGNICDLVVILIIIDG